MAPPTPTVVVPVDLRKKPWEQSLPLHNRWHPEIPAKPGDLLAVEICNLGPLPGDEWGYTATFDRENGGGFLTDHFPCATKAIWYFEGIYCYSPHIPGVRFPGLTHPGIIGTAPSMELLNIWNEREKEVEEKGLQSLKLCEVLHSRPLANLTPMGPTPLHVNPIFEIGPVEPRFSEWLVFEGISVDESGRQHYLDASVAFKRAVLNAIDYISRFGYTKEQVYLLLSCCPCEGRISGIVDSPNAVATLAIPTAIFDQDIRPKTGKVPVGPKIMKRPDVLKCTYDGHLPITKNPAASM